MTDEHDVTSGSDEADPAGSETDPVAGERSHANDSPESDNVQSLTDFFDQLDRAAFKRVLDNRDASRHHIRAAVFPSRSQRR